MADPLYNSGAPCMAVRNYERFYIHLNTIHDNIFIQYLVLFKEFHGIKYIFMQC